MKDYVVYLKFGSMVWVSGFLNVEKNCNNSKEAWERVYDRFKDLPIQWCVVKVSERRVGSIIRYLNILASWVKKVVLKVKEN